MTHRKPYHAPGTRGPVNENPVEGKDPGGRMNSDKGGGGNVSQPQVRGRGAVQESPISVDDRAEHY